MTTIFKGQRIIADIQKFKIYHAHYQAATIKSKLEVFELNSEYRQTRILMDLFANDVKAL